MFQPSIPTLIGYHNNNKWPILKRLILKVDLYMGLKSDRVWWRSAKLFLRYLVKPLREANLLSVREGLRPTMVTICESNYLFLELGQH